MNEGKDVHTLMAEIQLPGELEVGQGYGKVSWGVRAIWENYAGWFHHRSTTELFSQPQSAIHADLIGLAGGVEPMVERARTRLAAGDAVAAIQLLDIVMTEQPDHAAAIEVAIAAHRHLLQSSENFWLTSWLTHQLKVLQLRLD
jgi:alkyl sulfatase BDS1-like metallo-beta-lactamase superfamily hydrolase